MVTGLDGLIPPEMLAPLQDEAAMQYDTQVLWIPQAKTANGNPQYNKDGSSVMNYEAATVLPARVVQAQESFYNAQGIQIVSAQRIYVPPMTGVRNGDKIVTTTLDPIAAQSVRTPPVIDVREMPSPSQSIFELIRIASASSGTPLSA